MKFATATGLVILVVALASSIAHAFGDPHYRALNAQGVQYESLDECANLKSDVGPCEKCCTQFGQFAAEGRLLVLNPGRRQCKCVNEEQHQKIVDQQAEEEIKRLNAVSGTKQKFKSVEECSDLMSYTWTCNRCCNIFGKSPLDGQGKPFLKLAETHCLCEGQIDYDRWMPPKPKSDA